MTNLALLKQVLAQVEADLGAPEFVLFNPAPVQPSKALEFSEEELMQELTVSGYSLPSLYYCIVSCCCCFTSPTHDIRVGVAELIAARSPANYAKSLD